MVLMRSPEIPRLVGALPALARDDHERCYILAAALIAIAFNHNLLAGIALEHRGCSSWSPVDQRANVILI